MWTMAPSEIRPITCPISQPQKTMIKVFFGVNGIARTDILPAKTNLDCNYFRENFIKELGLIAYPTPAESACKPDALTFRQCPCR
jgi:hypothetical protein